jgi:hypothetical protein
LLSGPTNPLNRKRLLKWLSDLESGIPDVMGLEERIRNSIFVVCPYLHRLGNLNDDNTPRNATSYKTPREKTTSTTNQLAR